MREFQSGATRDDNTDKLQIHRFLSPEVQLRYCEYLQKHRVQADGKLRDPDNWKKGMDKAVYFESLTRHFFEAWTEFERTGTVDLDVMCAIRFNVDGFMFEGLREENKEVQEAWDKCREVMSDTFTLKPAQSVFGKSVIDTSEYKAAQEMKNEAVRQLADSIRVGTTPDPFSVREVSKYYQPGIQYPPLCPCGAKENEVHKPWCGGHTPE